MKIYNSKKIFNIKLILTLLILVILFISVYAMIEKTRYDNQLKKERPLYFACTRNNPELLREMIRLGQIPDINTSPYYGGSSVAHVLTWTSPLVRERRTTPKVIEDWDRRASTFINILFQNGADVKSCNGYIWYEAVGWDLESTVALLLENGFDPNLEATPGKTALQWAIFHNPNKNIVKMLIDYGADINFTDTKDNTPLHLATEYQADVSIITILLEAGADPTLKNKEGKTALDIERSRTNPDMEIINLLETYMEKYETSNTESE